MLTGIRENTARMHAVGAPVYWRLVLVYTLSATLAGVAGALLTQVNQFVGLNVLGLEPSGDLLVLGWGGGRARRSGQRKQRAVGHADQHERQLRRRMTGAMGDV